MDKKRKLVAETSRLNRDKKRQEFRELKEANGKMKAEQECLKERLELLNHQVEHQIPSTELELQQENNSLKEEINKHRIFIDQFAKLIRNCDNFSGKRSLLNEGVEAAHAYVQALTAESQTKWKPLLSPEPFNIPLDDFGMRYCIEENFLGCRGGRRFNLRIDFKFPAVSAKQLSDFYWAVWNSPEEQQQLYGVKSMELEKVDMPDDDTVLLYNRKTWNTNLHSQQDKSWRAKDQDAVFICNRHESVAPKSVLVPPHMEGDSFVGNTKVITIAMTSTRTTRETFETYQPDDKSADHITSIISQGASCWDDDDVGCSRMIMVLSYPEEYRWVDVSFSDVVESETEEYGRAGLPFCKLLLGIASRVRSVLSGAESI